MKHDHLLSRNLSVVSVSRGKKEGSRVKTKWPRASTRGRGLNNSSSIAATQLASNGGLTLGDAVTFKEAKKGTSTS